MARLLRIVLICGLAILGIGWFATRPEHVDASIVEAAVPDMERGETLFFAGGCAACHSAPDAEGGDKLKLAGGRKFPSPFGTFVAPNISPDPEAGIGAWTATDLANALLKGTGPRGQHYYPVLPYTSFARMSVEDVVSLHAYLATLPTDATPNQRNDVGFPFNIRRGLGIWKRLFFRDGWVVEGDLTEEQQLGRFLVEGPGHCGECHTPRNALGGLRLSAWLSGAPSPTGKGRIPDITPGGLDWSEADIAEYLKSGFTPQYDTVGGDMADVVANTSHLSVAERSAIAAYLKAVPPSGK
nr:cytochrome c [Tropicimonas sp. IMCC6043]